MTSRTIESERPSTVLAEPSAENRLQGEISLDQLRKTLPGYFSSLSRGAIDLCISLIGDNSGQVLLNEGDEVIQGVLSPTTISLKQNTGRKTREARVYLTPPGTTDYEEPPFVSFRSRFGLMGLQIILGQGSKEVDLASSPRRVDGNRGRDRIFLKGTLVALADVDRCLGFLLTDQSKKESFRAKLRGLETPVVGEDLPVA